MHKPALKRGRIKKVVLMLGLLMAFLGVPRHADAVIPQLLGPLTALLSIVPQILAFVGIALITALVFTRDTTKMVFYKCRELAAAHKVVTSVLGVIFLFGCAWVTYWVVNAVRDSGSSPTASIQNPRIGTLHSNRPWPTFRGGESRTGHIDALPGPTNGTPAWVFKDEEAMAVDFSSSPAVVGNRLYIGASHGSIFSLGGATYCIDTESREVIWRHASPIPIFSSPAVVGGRVYIGEGYHQDSNCHLRCLDAKTG